MRYFKTPWYFQMWYPAAIWKKASVPNIYLTFDDGPNPDVTPWVLNELSKVEAKATFFCLGNNVEKNRDLAREMIRRGHVIGNHTYNHLNGWRTNSDQYLEDVSECDHILNEIDVSNPLFRPPYGRISRDQYQKMKRRKIVFWSHMSYDFDIDLKIDQCLVKLKSAAPGSILVFHDNQKSYSNLKQILPELLEHFTRCGLKLEALK